MKTTLFYALFLIAIFCFAQPKNIKLPKGGEEMTIDKGTFLFSFYITKDVEVYFEDKKVDYYNDIAPNILREEQKISNNFYGNLIFYLYADINVPYKYVDRVKSEIRRVGHPRIGYKTDSYDNIMAATLSTLNGTVKGSLYNYKILTLEEELEREKFNKTIPPIPPLPAPY